MRDRRSLGVARLGFESESFTQAGPFIDALEPGLIVTVSSVFSVTENSNYHRVGSFDSHFQLDDLNKHVAQSLADVPPTPSLEDIACVVTERPPKLAGPTLKIRVEVKQIPGGWQSV